MFKLFKPNRHYTAIPKSRTLIYDHGTKSKSCQNKDFEQVIGGSRGGWGAFQAHAPPPFGLELGVVLYEKYV